MNLSRRTTIANGSAPPPVRASIGCDCIEADAIRAVERIIRPSYSWEVKNPLANNGEWDDRKLVATQSAYRKLQARAMSGCFPVQA